MQMLIRCGTIPYLWSSSCDIFQGTLNNRSLGNLTVASNSTSQPWFASGAGPATIGAAPPPPAGPMCEWTVPIPSSIPDAHTEMHIGTLPGGQVYVPVSPATHNQ